MWNEHCSYKSSKKYLRTLQTKNKKVIQGPGENARVIDIGDDDAIVFKIESHNHPSFIEPYQGAATGVGGILRDIFTMGARPIATLNSIHFGNHKHPKTKKAHPCPFPERLIDRIIKMSSNKNDVGLDIFSGSGTVMKVANDLHRRWIGIDQSKEYCEIAKLRIKSQPKQKKLF